MPTGIYEREPGIKYGMTSRHHSEKTKRKISIALKNRHNSPTTEFKKGPRPFARRKNNPAWKGGKYKSRNHIFVLQSNHPFCNKDGYVFEHRLIMEKHLGRYLKPKEVVHHKNGNSSDNRIKNLKLFANDIEHHKFHRHKQAKLKAKIVTAGQKL